MFLLVCVSMESNWIDISHFKTASKYLTTEDDTDYDGYRAGARTRHRRPPVGVGWSWARMACTSREILTSRRSASAICSCFLFSSSSIICFSMILFASSTLFRTSVSISSLLLSNSSSTLLATSSSILSLALSSILFISDSFSRLTMTIDKFKLKVLIKTNLNHTFVFPVQQVYQLLFSWIFCVTSLNGLILSVSCWRMKRNDAVWRYKLHHSYNQPRCTNYIYPNPSTTSTIIFPSNRAGVISFW